MTKRILCLALAVAMIAVLFSGLTVFAEPGTGNVSVEAYIDNGDTVVNLNGADSGVIIGARYSASDVLVDIKTIDITALEQYIFEGYSADKIFVWDSLTGMKPLCAPVEVRGEAPPTATPVVTEAPATATPDVTSQPSVKSGWHFNGIPVGTVYENGTGTVKDEDGRELTFAAAGADEVMPQIKERAVGDNYLEFADKTGTGSGLNAAPEGTSNQDSWTYESDPLGGDAVTYAMDVKKGDVNKDTILFRVYDTANTTSENSYGSDGRSFELKTGDSGALAFVDCYSADSSNKSAQTNVPGFTYSADEWFSVKVEYIKEDNKVNIYAGDTADSVTLKASYTLGKIGENSKTSAVPALSPNKVSCFTPGGGGAVLGVDNIDVNTVVYAAQNVPVSGSVYTTYSDDMKNRPEPFEGAGASLTFTDKNGRTVTAIVGNDGKYKTELMSGAEYTVSVAGADGYTLSPLSADLSITVMDLSAQKDVLLVNGLGVVQYKDTLEVGVDKEYNTIGKALSAVRKMTRSDGQTVTIKIDPGIYEEQLYIDVNDVALVAADPANKPMICCYYGIGYKYWSLAEDGWYNADNAVAKTEKHEASNWGAVIRLTDSVKNVLMENLDVQNTFNLYITDSELADGIEITTKNFDRSSKNTNVRSYGSDGPKERAAAIYAAGSEIELYRCSFVSSQDTFGTNTKSLYVKECDITGNTDYICGGNNAYFENCNLIWMGYSNSSRGGEITAHKLSSSADVNDYSGYYFKDCTIKNRGESGMKYPDGSKNARSNWGRPWGNDKCMVIFDNTTLDGAVKPSGWGSMDNKPMTNAKAAFVINGVWQNGNDVTAAEDNPKGTAASLGYKVPAPEDFFGGWEPKHYVTDLSKIKLNFADCENGSVSVQIDGASASRAVEGDTVKVVAVGANKNYGAGEITVTKTAGGEKIKLSPDNTFIMPGEEVTISAEFVKVSFAGTKYADWYIGESGASSTDGDGEAVTYDGREALHVKYRNVYKTLESPVTSGKFDFECRLWLDPSDSNAQNGFRIYLENGSASYYQDNSNSLKCVIAEVINTTNGRFRVGNGGLGDSGTKESAALTDLPKGWYTIIISADHSAPAAEFITVTVTAPDGAQVMSDKMPAISGIDTAINQIRLIDRNYHPYFADIEIK